MTLRSIFVATLSLSSCGCHSHVNELVSPQSMTDHVPPEGVEAEVAGSRNFDPQSIHNSRSNENSARTHHRK